MNPPPFPATLSAVWPWLRRHPVFPVIMVCAGSSGLSILLLAARKWLTGVSRLGFLPFNLILAFLPILFLLLSEDSGRRRNLIAGCALWLLFFPNAPYMLTDLVHYDRRLGNAAWLDMMALLAAAWAALIAGMTTLRLMQQRVARSFSPATGHAFVLTVLFLSAGGIYMGRFLRFHSWHALSKPGEVFGLTAEHFLKPELHPLTWPFTGALFALLVCMHYSLQAFTLAIARAQRE
ncbi:MAG: DUF1361 domain-containing protein [Verrucomicrobiota bacterium]